MRSSIVDYLTICFKGWCKYSQTKVDDEVHHYVMPRHSKSLSSGELLLYLRNNSTTLITHISALPVCGSCCLSVFVYIFLGCSAIRRHLVLSTCSQHVILRPFVLQPALNNDDGSQETEQRQEARSYLHAKPDWGARLSGSLFRGRSSPFSTFPLTGLMLPNR